MLIKPSFKTLTDVDLIVYGSDTMAVVQVKAGKHLEWAFATRQLRFSAEYVRRRFDLDPVCFYVHFNGKMFRAARTSADFTTWEPVDPDHEPSRKLSARMNGQFPDWRERHLPDRVPLYGAVERYAA